MTDHDWKVHGSDVWLEVCAGCGAVSVMPVTVSDAGIEVTSLRQLMTAGGRILEGWCPDTCEGATELVLAADVQES